MKIEVGDRVTYKNNTGHIVTTLITESWQARSHEQRRRNVDYKVERIGQNGWEVVEEKKELLTDEEREFLKFFIKHFEVESFSFNDNDIDVKSFEDTYICCPDYPKNMKFEGVEKYKKYDLKELRIGGINNGFRFRRT